MKFSRSLHTITVLAVLNCIIYQTIAMNIVDKVELRSTLYSHAYQRYVYGTALENPHEQAQYDSQENAQLKDDIVYVYKALGTTSRKIAQNNLDCVCGKWDLPYISIKNINPQKVPIKKLKSSSNTALQYFLKKYDYKNFIQQSSRMDELNYNDIRGLEMDVEIHEDILKYLHKVTQYGSANRYYQSFKDIIALMQQQPNESPYIEQKVQDLNAIRVSIDAQRKQFEKVKMEYDEERDLYGYKTPKRIVKK